MAFDPLLWTRVEFEGTPIYVRPDKPDWFVPNETGDRLLQHLADGGKTNGDLAAQRFLQRLPDSPPREYAGRAELLNADRLQELWLHVTNRCNLACSHCLFSSSPDDAAELPAERILDIAGQAHELGCRVFALTGGEPFVHRQFEQIVDGLLALDDVNVAVLTNGMLLRKHGEAMKRWPAERFHLQVSVDGLQTNHDRIRGAGAFDALMEQIAWLRGEGMTCTISMSVDKDNASDMPGVVDLAAEARVANVHFMWYFIRGRGEASAWMDPEDLFAPLTGAADRAEAAGVHLDNIEALKAQIFAPSGTIHDGTGSGWESAAVGPDGLLYPSPATIGVEGLATELNGDLATVWRCSPVMARLRGATVAELTEPWKLVLGGGDSDHSFLHSGQFVGGDPYATLQEKVLLWLIARQAGADGNGGAPQLRLKMGDVLESCGSHGEVATTHNNCLLSLAGADGRSAVKEFYTAAAIDPRNDIRNPVMYPEEQISHIPDASRMRTYGCGSPVMDAGLTEGDRVVDLGCGTGVECFIAARLVGPTGRAIGVDMLDAMLAFARGGVESVAERLGYANVDFRKGYLEELPLADGEVNVVLSNCVVNLSSNKRRTFAEIFRVLAPGGRLVIADVVCETEPSAAIRNDESLRGECIGGAMTQRDLFGLLAESGFVATRAMKRFHYRTVRGHPFYSMTFEAYHPVAAQTKRVMYRGPAAGIVTASGVFLPAGQTCEVPVDELLGGRDDVFELDAAGEVVNVDLGVSGGCGCTLSPIVEDDDLPATCCDPSATEGTSACCPAQDDEK